MITNVGSDKYINAIQIIKQKKVAIIKLKEERNKNHRKKK
jgi:hypothetical protein